MRVVASERFRVALAGLIAVGGLSLGISAAFSQQQDPVVVQQQPAPPPQTSGGTQAPAPAPTSGTSTQTTAGNGCTTPQPPGDWVCQNGVWTMNTSALNGGGVANPN